MNWLSLKDRFFNLLRNTTDQLSGLFFSKEFLFYSVIIITSFFVNWVFVFYPFEGKKWLFKIYKKPPQITLQKVEGPFLQSRMEVRVIKVQHKNKIYLEFLSRQPNGSYLFINSVELNGGREAYYIWGKRGKNSEISSLFLLDYDGNGSLDVVAPTFDQFFRPHINVLFYNPENNKFELTSYRDYPRMINRF